MHNQRGTDAKEKSVSKDQSKSTKERSYYRVGGLERVPCPLPLAPVPIWFNLPVDPIGFLITTNDLCGVAPPSIALALPSPPPSRSNGSGTELLDPEIALGAVGVAVAVAVAPLLRAVACTFTRTFSFCGLSSSLPANKS